MTALRYSGRNVAILALALLSPLFLYAVLYSYHFIRSPDFLPLSDATPPAGPVCDPASPVLLVSAYFPSPRAKHSQEEYRKWISNFLANICTDVYFYTNNETAPFIRSMRPGNTHIRIDTTFSSPFDVPPLRNLRENYETVQHDRDREKAIHSADLYAVWDAKPHFLKNAIEQIRRPSTPSPYNTIPQNRTYTYAFWNDAGSFRAAHHYAQWPHPQLVQRAFDTGARQLTGQSRTDLFFMPVRRYLPPRFSRWKIADGPVDPEHDGDFAEGSFFGGPLAAIPPFAHRFYALHDTYRPTFFIGKDQTIFNALLVSEPHKYLTVAPLDVRGACGNMWFYYQFFFAGERERAAMRRLWGRDRLGRFCETAEVRTMGEVLEESFRSVGWRAGRAR